MSVRVEVARFVLKLVFHLKYKFKFTYTNFDKNREDPFFLISNHASLNDPLYVAMNIKKYPYPVASNILYTNKFMKFGLNKVIKSIPKRKGQSDVQTIRHILNTFNKEQRSIMIFPEGNSSFFGEQTKTDYKSTAKIVKKISHDLVIAKINGGFFSSPRWGVKRRRPEFDIDYKLLLSKSEVDEISLEDLAAIIENAIKYNDYEWNKIEKIKYKSAHKAKGLEQYIYACPKCRSLQTIYTHRNDISCEKCGHLAKFNSYHLLEGLNFDNLIEWDHLQKKVLTAQKPNTLFKSSGKFYMIELSKGSRKSFGKVEATVNHELLILSNRFIQKPFHLEELSGLVLTQRNVLSFDYQNESYMIKMKDPMLFLDKINLHKGVL